jgi:L-rhamnose-H+ transport protein
MKVMSKWEWENCWLAFTFLGFIVLPAVLAYLTVPQLEAVLLSSPTRSVLLAGLFGLGWGAGSVCFGLGVRELGIGLAFSIVAGLTSALGSLIPWFTSTVKSREYSFLLWSGVILMLVGIAVCSKAGEQRESSLTADRGSEITRRRVARGLTICIVGGILSSFINFGFAYGVEVTRRAEALGASVSSAPNALWVIVMCGGFVSCAIYTTYLLLGRKSWKNYLARDSIGNFSWASVMGLLWVGCLATYGAGANRLGELGPSVGWPIGMSVSIVTSNLWSKFSGEWRGASRRAVTTMLAGLACLVLAVVLFGWASTKT